MAILYKTSEELEIMREAGRINALALAAMREAVHPGVSTLELDTIAAEVLAEHQAKPAFLHYPPGSPYPFPATITASINNELVHGIPSADRILEEGDIISLDCGTIYEGYVGDSAFTMGVGQTSPAVDHLLEVTEAALWVGIKVCTAGRESREVSKAIQRFVEGHGYSVVREYTGHGVGQSMHEDPQIPNWWPRHAKRRGWQNVVLKPGITFALEPMVNAGRPETRVLDDHWTVVTADGSLCAHFEHSVAVTEGEPLILTSEP
jgi:methionyl aminopeptidase